MDAYKPVFLKTEVPFSTFKFTLLRYQMKPIWCRKLK